ncbi:MAG TPA: hemerythrin domain-containing protein [Ardenticatenaceae bacterium]
MKRHPALQNLSRDHHLLLLQARQIRWYAAGDRRAPSFNVILTDFLDTWDETGAPHLRQEEAILLPFYARFPSAEQRQHERRALQEHQWLRAQIAALQQSEANQQELIAEIGAALHNHIRFEERILFQRIQALVPESDMQTLHAQLQTFREGLYTGNDAGSASPGQSHLNGGEP